MAQGHPSRIAKSDCRKKRELENGWMGNHNPGLRRAMEKDYRKEEVGREYRKRSPETQTRRNCEYNPNQGVLQVRKRRTLRARLLATSIHPSVRERTKI